ncbi:MAG: hypothetical protein NXY57DRAFT_968158 [Lentinula lateritia]|nr:MAG: hypothetical protein NXY57DRAFT_968158 [Lentinula lateritia]
MGLLQKQLFCVFLEYDLSIAPPDSSHSHLLASCLNIITHCNLYSTFPYSALNRKLEYFIDQTQHATPIPCYSRLDPDTPLQAEHYLLPALADVLHPNGELSFQTKRSFADPKSLITKINAGPRTGAIQSLLTSTIALHCWEIIYNVNSMSMAFQIVTPSTQSHSYCITNGSTIDYIGPNYSFNVMQHQDNAVVAELLRDIINRHRLTSSTPRNSLDVYSFSQLFHFLNHVQLLRPSALYIHWDTNNVNAVIVLTLYVHVIFHHGQKCSSLCSFNSELDDLLLLRMNMRFTWSYDVL